MISNERHDSERPAVFTPGAALVAPPEGATRLGRLRQRTARGPIGLLLNLFSSIWLGVVLLSLLFIYSSIGSAGVPTHWNILDPASWEHGHLRMWRGFELTEFEWFHWWPFKLLIAIICVNLVVATLRRIPFNIINLGVWMIHTGIITLALGSVWYFSTKVEGDAPVLRRQIRIEAPGTNGKPVVIAAQPGARAMIGSGADAYLLEVASIDPQWEMLSGAAKGRRAYSVNVMVQSQAGQFIRQLIAGYPEHTEDIIPSGDSAQPMTRAKKALGKPLVDEVLQLSLEYAPQDYFYLMDSRALYLRALNADGTPRTEWIERPIHGLPRYNDYIASASDVWMAKADANINQLLDPLAVEVPAARQSINGISADPLADTPLRVSRYLRYARLDSERRPAAEGPLDPVVSVTLRSPSEGGAEHIEQFQLIAFDPQNNAALEGVLRFVWADSQAAVDRLKRRVPPVIRFAVPDANISIDETIESTLTDDPALAFKPIAGTDYAYRVENVQDNLSLGDRTFSVAIVQIRAGEGAARGGGTSRTFKRWIFDDPRMNRDLALAEGMAQHEAEMPLDTKLETVYQPGERPPAPVMLIGGPGENDLVLLVTRTTGQPRMEPLAEGQTVVVRGEVTLTVDRYAPRTVSETRPVIVPRDQRDSDVGEMMSMICVDVPLGNGATQLLWMPYHHFAFESRDEALFRFPYQPSTLALADGRLVQLMFSRARMKLPAPVALDDFQVDTHVGGFTGRTSSIMDWISMVRFAEDTHEDDTPQWGAALDVRVNKPKEFGGYWFFQAQWDPPAPPQFPGDSGSAGLNYTVLGVGNRNGVHVQLVGCCIAVLGMLYAFYMKPIIKRRRQQRVYAESKRMTNDALAPVEAEAELQPVGVALRKTMRTRGTIIIAIMLLFAACGWATLALAQAPAETPAQAAVAGERDEFAEVVDLGAIGRIAVHTEGRIKSFDSFARSAMQFVSGSRRIEDRSPTFTYLDLMLRPERYRQMDVIYFKNKPMRVEVAHALRAAQTEGALTIGQRFSEQQANEFIRTGLLSRDLLESPAVLEVLARLSADVRRSAKFVQAITAAVQVMDADSLSAGMKVVPPPPSAGAADHPWMTPEEHASFMQASGMVGEDPIAAQWQRFTKAWSNGDATGVNEASAALASLLPQVNPALYPDQARLSWESWYFRAYNMTWVWILYALALIPLLLAVVFHWPAARWMGLLMFVIAFGLHTLALGLRWYVSGRWPNSNMFESITTAAWFGGCVAILFELFGRRLPMRNLFALGSAAASMTALMAVYFLPLQLNADIQNKMPVLNDVWLYIHTNVIILSYCLIFIAAVTAGLYLLYRLAGYIRGTTGMRDEYARVGGAGSLIMTRPDGGSYLSSARASLGQVLDGTTMVVMEMSFILLWTGLVMGAIWADHSWGRPWGWDPKEVFALNTFLVFLVLVHGRLKVRDKGLWTAAMALLGAGVMLFNWIIINFAITGLHSYA